MHYLWQSLSLRPLLYVYGVILWMRVCNILEGTTPKSKQHSGVTGFIINPDELRILIIGKGIIYGKAIGRFTSVVWVGIISYIGSLELQLVFFKLT